MSAADTGRRRAPSTPRLVGRLLWIGVVVWALALVAVLGGRSVLERLGLTSQPAPLNGAVLSPPRDLPPLTLQRAGGGPWTTADLRGRVSLVFFGYTYCPDVCPLTLMYVTQVREKLGARSADVDAYFVTVDPDRDTPERMATYLKGFKDVAVGVTGTEEQLAAARTAFGAFAERRAPTGGGTGYTVDHSAGLHLVGRDGRVLEVFPYGMDPALIAEDVTRVLRDEVGGRP